MLHQQAVSQNIDFEILVFEDGSTHCLDENRKIEALTNCKYQVLKKNIGRSAIRNELARSAVYDHLLFLDCDAEIPSDSYLSRYLAFCDGVSIVLGGRIYDRKYLTNQNSLVFKYGSVRERNVVQSNIALKHFMFTTPNFLIPKSVFSFVKFDESIKGYGHEDTIFGVQLKKLGFTFFPIDNPVIHVGLEDNDMYIQKTKNGIRNLYDLSLMPPYELIKTESKLLAFFAKVQRLKLSAVFSILYVFFLRLMELNLKSTFPSLFVFDVYKILFLCNVAQLHKKSKRRKTIN